MIKLRTFIFLFLFCTFNNCGILYALHAKLEINNVCSTPACHDTATIIRQYMDPNASPCDDFNKFACGTLLKNITIPKGLSRIDRYDIINQKIQQQVKVSLEAKIQTNEPRWLRLVKGFYQACMNTIAIGKHGIREVLDDLRKLGGWPILEGKSWIEAKFDWKQSTYDMKKFGYGTDHFFTLKVDIDPSNEKRRLLFIDQPSLSIDREELVKGFNNPRVKAYFSYMVEIAFRFGANKAVAEKELKDALKFEIDLATICISDADKSNATSLNTPMTVAMLSQTYHSIPWEGYFNTIYKIVKSSIIIGKDDVIIVTVPDFFKNFEGLMKKTPKRALANYHLWKAVQEDLNYLTDEIRNIKSKFEGEVNRKPRWNECLGSTAGVLEAAVGALYARKYVGPATKRSAEEIAYNIEKRFKINIQEADWMDEKTRINALNRLASINNFIGYPVELNDDNALNEFYKKVEITPNDYFQAATNMSLFWDDFFFNQLRKPVNGSAWYIHSNTAIVGPFFSIEGNGPEIPGGILQDVFFNKDVPYYLNFAGIGTFNMGHEITHLFDNVDAYMTPETKKKYLVNADCITKQYGNYTAENGLKLNGAFTQRENINDNSGVKTAYLAYQDWAKQHGPEPKLPGLTKYSIPQLFWLNAAMTQCDKYTPEFLKAIVLTDIHSPSSFRIIGTFSNRPEFARDFNCPVGSKMNPVEKCSVW